jgi:dTDP-4-dehydrorhamnose reductase
MSKSRIVITGAGGRLGRALCRAYSGEFEVVVLDRRNLDLASSSSVDSTLSSIPFDVVINCAAMTNVDYCETNEIEANRVNSEAPRRIAEIAESKGAKMIQISTDYVFRGDKATPYTEEDPAQAISVYGRSKQLGEEMVLGVSKKNLVVRVAWVFGPDRPSFIDAIVKRALNEEKIEAIGDKYSSPSFTIDTAEYLRPFLNEIDFGGLLHICNPGACTWREYGEYAINVAAEAGMPVRTRQVGMLTLADMKNFVAQRPIYTVLATDRLAALIGRQPRPWQEAVDDYIRTWVARTT